MAAYAARTASLGSAPFRTRAADGASAIHPAWDEIVDGFAAVDVSHPFASNRWHIRRLMPSFHRHAQTHVRLSLSGGTEAVHDAGRGRESFRRVLFAVEILTSRA